jgi:uncharacterized protein YlzI (FlbEa/FlbD family)
MSAKFILEEVTIVENDFSADSRDKSGKRVVLYEKDRSLQLHLAISHVLQIEAVVDTKAGEQRSVLTMSSGLRYVTRRSADEVRAAIAKANAGP